MLIHEKVKYNIIDNSYSLIVASFFLEKKYLYYCYIYLHNKIAATVTHLKVVYKIQKPY